MIKTQLSIATSVVNALIWGYPAIFAGKFFGNELSDIIRYNSPPDAVYLFVAGGFAIAGAVIVFLFAVLNFKDKISPIVQIIILTIGLLALWSLYPN